MNVIKNMPIKSKLIAIILATTVPIMLIGIWIEASISITNMEKSLSENSVALAKNLAENSVGPITFSDKKGIERIAAIVTSNQTVTDVMVYDHSGELFFRHHQSGNQLESNFKPIDASVESDGNYLHIYRSINYEGNNLGLIYMRVSRSNILQEMNRFIIEMILISLFLILISVLLAAYMQRLISKPISNLVHITQSIGATGNLNTPILYKATDEIGQLYTAFNTFINTIKSRENDLLHTNKKLIASENRLKKLIESSFDGVVIIDQNNMPTFCNQAFLKMFNSNFETLKQFKINTLLSDNEMVDRIINNSSGINDQTRSAIAEVTAKPIGLKHFTAEFTAVHIEIDEQPMHVVTLHDVSYRKEIESELQTQTEQVKTAELQRTGYILSLAHDLKSPLNSIIGFSELIKDENVPSEKKLSFANFIGKSGRLLLHSINTILDILRIEAKL
ncbi:MAG TPA: hypothetical protein DCQ31_03335, partial [Bacteroidales bacterium]|nr:hypothetical protein [Bacteroidales bacterium]